MKNRIWELDALRGICILAMVLVHLCFDLAQLFAPRGWDFPGWFSLVMEWGGAAFFVISGVCVTLGKRSLRRGLTVFGCGMLCSAVTWGLMLLDFSDESGLILFGVLHCLGLCMILWSLFRHYPKWALLGFGAVLSLTGIYLLSLPPLDIPHWLMLFGLQYPGFVAGDWFPILPFLGFFLLGAWLGRVLYAGQRSLLPRFPSETLPVRFLCACGRHSLWIYLLHQPLILGLVMLLDAR